MSDVMYAVYANMQETAAAEVSAVYGPRASVNEVLEWSWLVSW